MPRDLKIIIIFVIFSGLILPNFNILAKPLEFKPASVDGAVFTSQPEVKVAALVSSTQVVAPSRAAVFNSCQNTGGMSGNLVQDTGLLNLNQPAGCFSLSLGKVAALDVLGVRPLRPLVSTVKVIAAKPVILPDSLNPFPGASRGMPMLPGVAPFTAVIIFAGLEKIRHKRAMAERKNSADFSGFFRFEILRC